MYNYLEQLYFRGNRSDEYFPYDVVTATIRKSKTERVPKCEHTC